MTVQYLGGPLDGQEAAPRRGRWSIYRRDDGETLPTTTGDAVFCTGGRGRSKHHGRHYVRQGDLYVHGSIVAAFRAGQLDGVAPAGA